MAYMMEEEKASSTQNNSPWWLYVVQCHVATIVERILLNMMKR
jgi:hypothetical protein